MNILLFLRSFSIFFLTSVTILTRFHWCFSSSSSFSSSLGGGGHFSFDETSLRNAARDFGNRFQYQPMAVMNPESVSDIANTIKHVWLMGPSSHLTVAARGHGHSLQGQAQAPNGIVINMESLKLPGMQVHLGRDSNSDSDSDSDSNSPYVDVSGGELWINILHETLRFGLTPRSWTDYLHLTVGGTLSNAGVSGQAFRHGPQISNVQKLEIVTGTGQVVNCSKDENGELFHSVLGGLGQFGIITRARILLEPAPSMVKWIRVLYSDFTSFTSDQERLISSSSSSSSENDNAFDYIEGFVIINRTGLLNNWRSTFNPQDPIQASQFKSDGRTLFCLELAKYFNPQDINVVNEEVEEHLSYLHYIESTLFLTEVTYVEFLDRVHVSELKLRSKGLWDVPHPWLNLFIPRSNIHKFAQEVFGNILTETSNGPVLIYPVNKSKWDNRSSVVTPEEEVFYLVGILASAVGREGIEEVVGQNRRILEYCERSNLGVKQYLPHYNTQDEWKAHFGPKWESFLQRKSVYDPLAIMAPGQRIFQKAINFS